MFEPCRVCGEPTSEHCNAVCNACAQAFHLALRQDVPAKDCGQVWINEELMALEFVCNVCLTDGASGGDVSVSPIVAPGAPQPKRRYARREGVSASAVARARRGLSTGPSPKGEGRLRRAAR